MMYRVSQRSLFRNVNMNLGYLTWKMAQINNQLASGKKVNKPSDDPTGGATILAMRTVLSDIKQYKKDVALADDWLKTSESVLQSMKTTVERANVLCEQMSTDTYVDFNMDVAADEVDKLFESLIKMGNTKIGDRYIFAGHHTEGPAFADDLTIHDTLPDPNNSVMFTGDVITQGSRIFNYRPDIPRQTQQFIVEMTSPGGVLSGTSGHSLALLALDPPGDHNALFFQAVDALGTAGSAGNSISIQYVASASITTAQVTVAGSAITVHLGTSAGAVISTGAEVISAINTGAASALVTASLVPGNSGQGLMAAQASQNLANGYDSAATFRVSQDGGLTWSVHDAFTADDLKNFGLIYNTELGHANTTTHMDGVANDLYFVAKEMGSYGNDIRVQLVADQSSGSAISVEIGPHYWNITVHLQSTTSDGIVSTAEDVMNAINNHTSASQLVTASLADYREGGAGFVTELELTALSGGTMAMDPLGYATYTTDLEFDVGNEPNPNIRFQALTHGTSGNSINIEYSSACAQTFTSFAVSGSTITVFLGNSAGNILTTAQDVVTMFTSAYINNPASAMVVASLVEWPDGKTAVVGPMETITLTGGDPLLDEANHGVNIRFEGDGSPLSLGDRFEIDVDYYLGDDEDLNTNADADTRVKINVTGEDALGDTGAYDNILDTLARLSFALREHDTKIVADELPRLNDALEKLTTEMSSIGVRLIRNTFITNVLEDRQISSTARMSSIEDLDFEDAVTALTTYQTSYQAALASTNMITQLSLVDYIR